MSIPKRVEKESSVLVMLFCRFLVARWGQIRRQTTFETSAPTTIMNATCIRV